MRSRLWVFLLVPAVAFASVALVAYAYAAANPLTWGGGYGHVAVRVNTNVTVAAKSSAVVPILGDAVIPAKSYVWTEVFVATKGSDGNPVPAVFKFLYNGEESAAIPGRGMGQDFETTVETRGAANPRYVIENVQPFDIVVLEDARVMVAPTTAEHFLLFLPWVLFAGGAMSAGVDGVLVAMLRPRPRTPVRLAQT